MCSDLPSANRKKWYDWLLTMMHVNYLRSDLWAEELPEKFVLYALTSQLIHHCTWMMLLGDWCYLTKPQSLKFMYIRTMQSKDSLYSVGWAIVSMNTPKTKQKSKLGDPGLETGIQDWVQEELCSAKSAEDNDVLDLCSRLHLRNSRHLPFIT